MTGASAAVPGDGTAETTVVVAIDADVCVGIGQCELLEPEVFALDDDLGYSAVVGSGRLPAERAQVVVDKCPSNAIRVVEGGRVMTAGDHWGQVWFLTFSQGRCPVFVRAERK